MAVFKCKMCGGALNIEDNQTTVKCDYCGTTQTLPKLDDERRANMYDRANHFRRNNDYDKAMSMYEQILAEDNKDSEAYWSIVLCRYGIEYVEDPSTHKRLPTVNRAQYTSIFADEDYKAAIANADTLQKSIYEQEAKAIDEIQKGILEISNKEEPFDVFISFKETDANGRRTPDAVLANELYHGLTQEGFKVFYAPITLEDKLGTAYEPYIFAALNSAKVMVVLGTKPENFNAVWVKNEWSRFLALIKNGAKKTLIPAYKDMDPYDLPDEFSHLMAQDMSKLGFMQDIIRGIRKIVNADAPKTTAREAVVVNPGNANTAPLLKRAFMFLEDGEWDRADDFCEQVLNQDPENAQAYLGKLMAEKKARRQEDLKDSAQPFDTSNNYQKVIRFADPALADTLRGYIKRINERNENDRIEGVYGNALRAMSSASSESAYRSASGIFKSIPGYKDSDALSEECLEKAEECRKDSVYDSAKALMIGENVESYEQAIKTFRTIPGWKDSGKQIDACSERIWEIKRKAEEARLEAEKKAEEQRIAKERAKQKTKKALYIVMLFVITALIAIIVINNVVIPGNQYNQAVAIMESGNYDKAIILFEALGGYKDSEIKIQEIKEIKYELAETLLAQGETLRASRAFFELGDYKDAKEQSFRLWDQLAMREFISTGANFTVGLKADGTVVAVGGNGRGQCGVSNWKDIVAISAGSWHTVGLKSDGTVVAVGDNDYGQCNVSGWKDIVAVSAGHVHHAGSGHTVGLKADGTVVAVGENDYGQCNVSGWKDIVAVSAVNGHTVGLKADGTVVAVGENFDGQCDVSGWKEIVAISAEYSHTVGLKADGTVVAVGRNMEGQCDVSGWKDIVAISTGSTHTVGLKEDGTVVAAGRNTPFNMCDVSRWKDIVAIFPGSQYTVALKADGTVVAVGRNDDGQCDVSGWKNIKLPNK